MAATAGETSAPGDLALGHAIFANGQGGGAPCANCHGRDGLGGGEADAPAILWTTLSREPGLRPAYDAAGFARALGGTAPGGRSLSRLMPRYDLDAGQLRALMAYLKALPQLQRQGVETGAIRIGVVGGDYLRAFRAPLDGHPVHGREIRLLALNDADPPPADPPVLAIVAPRLADTVLARQAAAQGIPVLFPLAPLSGDESPSIMKSFVPTQQSMLDFLAIELRDAGARSVAVVTDADSDAGQRARRQLRVALAASGARVLPGDQVGQATDLVLLGQAMAVPGNIRRVWITGAVAPGPLDLPAQAELRLIVTAPMVIETAIATDRPVLDVHAGFAARLLQAALMQAGRDLTRTGLMRAFEQMPAPIRGLDYQRLPLTGTDALQVVSFAPD